MNAAKRKAESAPDGLAARMLPFLRQPYRGLLLVLVLAAGLTGGAYYGWQRVGPQVTQGPEYLLEPDQIEITPPPPWIRSDVRGETVRDGGLSGLSILDRELTVKIARAFGLHTWVEEVRRVRKEHPARVVVELAYRRPVAMVEVTMNDRPGLLPVDVNGVLLPPGDFSAEQARDYLRVSLADATPAGPAPSGRDYAMWLAFSALGSVMLLASTSHITQNIASVPFLWVLPLSLYLLTFVLAFEGRGGRGWYERWMMFVTLLFVVGMAAGLSAGRGVLDVSLAVPLYTAGMFMAVFFCNGELALRKPAPRYLTQFYLTISLGGALGGLFVGLVAPRLFPTTFELPLALMALAAMGLVVVWNNKFLIGPALVASLATAWYGSEYLTFLRDDVIYMHRNFYGTLRVRETGGGDKQVRRLLHGVILHGEQFTRAENRLEPGTYYARSSGIGLAIAARQAAGPVTLGFVGLGVGTLSAYGREGDLVRFYELDPRVIDLAQRHFTFLGSTKAALEFEIGDARLSLEREFRRNGGRGYDVLAIDAFSSDSIPVHLITREAMELYARHIAPDGIIAVHISNRFLDLKPVLANIAQATGLAARLVSDSPGDDSSASNTDWVLLARDPRVLDDPVIATRAEALDPVPGFSLWTDQFNNLFDVLKVRPIDELRAILGLG